MDVSSSSIFFSFAVDVFSTFVDAVDSALVFSCVKFEFFIVLLDRLSLKGILLCRLARDISVGWLNVFGEISFILLKISAFDSASVSAKVGDASVFGVKFVDTTAKGFTKVVLIIYCCVDKKISFSLGIV